MGQRVLCRYDVDGYFYPGTIERDPNERSVVFFDNEIEQPMKGQILIPYDQGGNQLRLYLFDCVLVRLTNEIEEYWVPGLIRCPPASPFALPPQIYLVEIHDPASRHVRENQELKGKAIINMIDFIFRSMLIGKI